MESSPVKFTRAVKWRNQTQFNWDLSQPYSEGILRKQIGKAAKVYSHDCKFFAEYTTADNGDYAKTIYKKCQMFRTPSLLPPLLGSANFTAESDVAGNTTTRDVTVLVYEFDNSFLHRRDSLPPLFNANGRIDKLWRRNARSLLQTIGIMHDNGITHQNLHDPDSYVMIGDDIFILMPRPIQIEISRVDDFHKSNDVLGFKLFLDSHYESPHGDGVFSDWSIFEDLAKIATIPQLLKSSAILGGEEIYNYFRQLLNHKRYNRGYLAKILGKGMINEEGITAKLPMAQYRYNLDRSTVFKSVLKHAKREVRSIRNTRALLWLIKRIENHYDERQRALIKAEERGMDEEYYDVDGENVSDYEYRDDDVNYGAYSGSGSGSGDRDDDGYDSDSDGEKVDTEITVDMVGEELTTVFPALLSMLHYHLVVEYTKGDDDDISHRKLPPTWGKEV